MKLIIFPLLLCLATAKDLSTEEEKALYKAIWEDREVIEGDIMILPNQERLAAYQYSRKWPGGVIPYEIDTSVASFTPSINEAIWHLQNATCLKFKEDPNARSRLVFIASGGCQSFIGKMLVPQPIELAGFCNNSGSILHEILHAAGFVHEHNRSDRDKYIQINWSNIRPDAVDQFIKHSVYENNLLTAFDIESIMHYGEYNGAFAGVKAMESKIAGQTIRSPEDKGQLSPLDIQKVKDYYNC